MDLEKCAPIQNTDACSESEERDHGFICTSRVHICLGVQADKMASVGLLVIENEIEKKLVIKNKQS